MLVLTGTFRGGSLVSTFDFFDEVVEFDLRGFFERNSAALREEVTELVKSLLSA